MMPLESLAQQLLVTLEVLGTAAFALSGVISAVRKRMDVVGICVCGFLAAFGGGTLRDLLIDRRPFFWVEHQLMLIGVLALCIIAASVLSQRHFEASQKMLQIPDALGLGLFCATGIHLSWSLGQPAVVAIMMGVITGTFGGVLRDVVCNEIPSLFKDHRPYALCALAGALLYALLRSMEVNVGVAIGACTLATSGLRALTLWRDWRLPSRNDAR
jgi:uncharacterized membrane protein YeiH